MTDPNQDQRPTEEQSQAALWELFDRIDEWQAALSAGELFPLHLPADSRMAGDDRATAPLQMSHVIQTSLSVAIEHLHATAALVRKAQLLHNSPPFTLVRSTLESAALAHWILEPDSRSTRIKRLLAYHEQDLFDYHEFSKLIQNRMGGDLPPTIASRPKFIAEIDARNKLIDGHKRRVQISDVVAKVDLAVPDHDPHYFEILWKTASGFAHGRQWAYINALIRDEVSSVVEGVGRFEVANTLSRVLWGVGAGVELTDRALVLFFNSSEAGSEPATQNSGQ